LDEIGECPGVAGKLPATSCRIIPVCRLGGSTPIKVGARVIAAHVESARRWIGALRQDLITLEYLTFFGFRRCARLEEIPVLLETFHRAIWPASRQFP